MARVTFKSQGVKYAPSQESRTTRTTRTTRTFSGRMALASRLSALRPPLSVRAAPFHTPHRSSCSLANLQFITAAAVSARVVFFVSRRPYEDRPNNPGAIIITGGWVRVVRSAKVKHSSALHVKSVMNATTFPYPIKLIRWTHLVASCSASDTLGNNTGTHTPALQPYKTLLPCSCPTNFCCFLVFCNQKGAGERTTHAV